MFDEIIEDREKLQRVIKELVDDFSERWHVKLEISVGDLNGRTPAKIWVATDHYVDIRIQI